jgi:hypothetical protein
MREKLFGSSGFSARILLARVSSPARPDEQLLEPCSLFDWEVLSEYNCLWRFAR